MQPGACYTSDDVIDSGDSNVGILDRREDRREDRARERDSYLES